MGFVGGYVLQLYCDEPRHHRRRDGTVDGSWGAEFGDETRAGAVREARAAGWRIAFVRKTDTMGRGVVTCPLCVRENARQGAEGKVHPGGTER